MLWLPAVASAHDLERTRVTIAIDAGNRFVVDVANDPAWLWLRLEPFAGGVVPANATLGAREARLAQLAPVFVDRVVLFVDRHEVRADSAEYLPEAGGFRLRGRLPDGARTLHWFYGLVVDPYQLTVRFADGRTATQVVAGEAWSTPIDLPERQRATRVEMASLIAVFLVAVGLQAYRRGRRG
jgi:hypothetical protein